MTEQGAQLYQLSIVASGEVRDKDGNLIGQQPIEATHMLTVEQAAQLIERLDTP